MSEQLPGVTPAGVADPFHDPLSEYAELYPEVVEAGSLQSAIQTAVDREGLALAVELTSSPGWRYVAAMTEADDRSANVLMADGARTFMVDCWADGVHMASGSTQNLAQVAGALHTWIQGAGVRDLVARWAFLRTWEPAEAHERGEAVPARWQMMRESAARRQDADWQDLIESAFEQPRLRVLSPGRSMFWLTFSRRAAPPICRDLPRTRPLGNGRFEVAFADGRVQEVDGAAATVAMILDGLPDDAAPRPLGS
ncbi:DUF6193 family natural product biosynthesis protein [Streptomyces sp. NPDC046977]|uniref:DUF6193 family natural product biosynthesis protein n=1 Tax=Streptomyces sp. NPDC046977 TaxID=3154703 RepID=UPI0033E8FFF7